MNSIQLRYLNSWFNWLNEFISDEEEYYTSVISPIHDYDFYHERILASIELHDLKFYQFITAHYTRYNDYRVFTTLPCYYLYNKFLKYISVREGL